MRQELTTNVIKTVKKAPTINIKNLTKILDVFETKEVQWKKTNRWKIQNKVYEGV